MAQHFRLCGRLRQIGADRSTTRAGAFCGPAPSCHPGRPAPAASSPGSHSQAIRSGRGKRTQREATRRWSRPGGGPQPCADDHFAGRLASRSTATLGWTDAAAGRRPTNDAGPIPADRRPPAATARQRHRSEASGARTAANSSCRARARPRFVERALAALWGNPHAACPYGRSCQDGWRGNRPPSQR